MIHLIMFVYIEPPLVKLPSDCGCIYGKFSVVNMNYYYTEQIATVIGMGLVLCCIVLQ